MLLSEKGIPLLLKRWNLVPGREDLVLEKDSLGLEKMISDDDLFLGKHDPFCQLRQIVYEVRMTLH